jgi:hypothetical protein
MPVAPLEMTRVAAACASAIVETQQELDIAGRASLVAWEDDGLPPTLLTLATCTVQLPIAFTRVSEGPVELCLDSSADASRRLTLRFRYLPRPQDELEAEMWP